MLIKTPKSWEIPASQVTDETLFLNRRSLLKAAGFMGSSLLLAGLPKATVAQPGLPLKSGKNPAYQSGNPTSEDLVTGYNNYYEFTTDKEGVKTLAEKATLPPWKLLIDGLVERPQELDLDQIAALGLEQRIYRFRCVEAWSMVVPWDGLPLHKLLALAQPQPAAKYVAFTSLEDATLFPGQNNKSYPWPYREGLRLDEARHELAFLSLGVYGRQLPTQNGAPLRLVVPWKYGFKSVKAIVKLTLTDKQPATMWNEIAPREYGFFANVNPEVDHPRWSQKSEKLLGGWFQRQPTLLFNGYPEVARLYQGLDLKRWF